MNWLEVSAYLGLSGIVATLTGWRFVLWCVDKSAEKIRHHTSMSDYTEEEKELIEKYLQESLNKIK
jgi:hypothetical protein